MTDIENLESRWKYLYQDHLPMLARAKDLVQENWPVSLDHCFARIVLDNAVGIDRVWSEVVKAPAVKNMDATQFEAAIDLAERIATGEANLSELNEQSLTFRGKKRKASEMPKESPTTNKKQRVSGSVSSYFLPSQKQSELVAKNEDKENVKSDLVALSAAGTPDDEDMTIQFKRIEESDLTQFRKQMLTLLCQIPRGRYSTYKELSDYVSRTSHKTCARAVGNAMRNNPFAPEVPCHRVIANDGSLGGFKGYWGEGGKFASKKHELLYEEGVRFDSKGKVKGLPFRDFSA